MAWRHGEACPCCAGAASRRDVIQGALGALACVALFRSALAAGPSSRVLRIRRVQSGEAFEGAYWRDGRYDREVLRQLDILFRDPTRDEVTPMDPRLFDVLWIVADRVDSQEYFEVISGYRAPETNAASAARSRRVSRVSLHMSGMAADVRLPDRDSYGVARIAADLQTGGVGLYRRDGFVHLDCGPARRW